MKPFGTSIVPSPTTTTIAPVSTSQLLGNNPMLLIGAFGISLIAAVSGQGTVRTLGILGMLGTAGLFLASNPSGLL